MKRLHVLAALAAMLASASAATAQAPRVIYDFELGDEGWAWAYNGDPIFTSAVGGALVFTTPAGAVFPAFAEDSNNTSAQVWGNASCTPLTAVSALEFDIGYVGADPTITLQFYAQADSTYDYVVLGSAAITGNAGVQTVTVPLTNLTDIQRARVRQFGFQINNEQTASADWTMSEVRSAGATPGTDRTLVTFQDTKADGGIEGMFVNFSNAAIVGNNGGQNNTGITQVNESGTDGVIQFTTQFVDGATGGGALTFGNGFGAPFDPSLGYLNRPIDITGYDRLEAVMKATGPAGAPVTMQLFAQTTGSYTYNTFDVDGSLPRDGAFHTLSWDLNTGGPAIAERYYSQVVGFNLREVASGESPVTIQIDEIRLIAPAPPASDAFFIY